MRDSGMEFPEESDQLMRDLPLDKEVLPVFRLGEDGEDG